MNLFEQAVSRFRSIQESQPVVATPGPNAKTLNVKTGPDAGDTVKNPRYLAKRVREVGLKHVPGFAAKRSEHPEDIQRSWDMEPRYDPYTSQSTGKPTPPNPDSPWKPRAHHRGDSRMPSFLRR